MQSLYRRLVALNRCATMRLDNAHHSKHQSQVQCQDLRWGHVVGDLFISWRVSHWVDMFMTLFMLLVNTGQLKKQNRKWVRIGEPGRETHVIRFIVGTREGPWPSPDRS